MTCAPYTPSTWLGAAHDRCRFKSSCGLECRAVRRQGTMQLFARTQLQFLPMLHWDHNHTNSRWHHAAHNRDKPSLWATYAPDKARPTSFCGYPVERSPPRDPQPCPLGGPGLPTGKARRASLGTVCGCCPSCWASSRWAAGRRSTLSCSPLDIWASVAQH